MGIYDVPATELIETLAKELEKELKAPEFTAYVKTGTNRERAPQKENWWYIRSAAIIYRVNKDGPVGTERLRTYYGGKKNRGRKPSQFRKASGKVIRSCLQELEKSGYLAKTKKGRETTGKAKKAMNTIAKQIGTKKQKDNKE